MSERDDHLVPNTSGRACITFFAFGVVGVADEQQRWLPIIILAVSGVASLHICLITALSIIYSQRFMNVIVMIVYLLIDAGLGMLMAQNGMLNNTFIAAISLNCAEYALIAAILAAPSGSRIAMTLHPFIEDTELGGRSREHSSHHHHHHKRTKKRIKHREVSIFQDFPAPIPFPARALYSYTSTTPNEVSFTKGDQLVILDCRGNWWQAKHPHTGVVGFVPSNYIQVIQKAKVTTTHTASAEDEISAMEGQIVEVMEMHECACLIRGVDGAIGSIPTECLEVLGGGGGPAEEEKPKTVIGKADGTAAS